MDPGNTFAENERQNYGKQWAMGNVESVSKCSKISVYFYTKTGQKVLFGKNYHKTPANWMLFH